MSKTQSTDIRGNILKAAAQIIAAKGIKNTSLSDISKAVGMSKGTLYYYYSSKDTLICDIADIHLKSIKDELFSWLDSIPTETINSGNIIKVVLEKVVKLEARGRIHLYIVSEALAGNTVLKERLRNNYREWRQTLKAGIERFLTKRKIDVEAVSFILLAMLDGFVIQWLLQSEEIPFGEISQYLG